MPEFKTEDSLGAQPLTEQVAYLQRIGDPDAKAMINDMLKFAPKIDEMRIAVADYIRNKDVEYKERVRVWFETPEVLLNIEDYMLDDDEAIEAAIPDWVQRVADHKHDEVDLRYVYITGDEFRLPPVDVSKLEYVRYGEFEVPKVIVDHCIERGIHGFILNW